VGPRDHCGVRERVCGGAIALLICLSASGARAQQPAAPGKNVLERAGLDLSARVALALPFGDIMAGDPLGAWLSSELPVVIEFGLRVNKNLAVAMNLELGPTFTKYNCGGCDTTEGIQLNLEAIFTARAGLAIDPWLGLGTGLESVSFSPGDQANGWNYALIEAGGEFRVGDHSALGPFIGLSIGEYTSVTAPETYFTSRALHEWFRFGMRGTINN